MSRLVMVVGTVNHDRVVASDGARREGLGGILYNVAALAALVEGTDVRVRACGRLGEEHRRQAAAMLAAFPAADASGLVADPAGTNLSVLDYTGPGERHEEVHLRVAPLAAADLDGVDGADAVLVNMISGRDLALDTLREVRRRTSGLMLLDIQALARTLESPRRPRSEPAWEDWCRLFDVVRGNEEEVAHFPGAPGDVLEGMRRMLDAGATEVIATRGPDGSRRAVRAAGRIVLEEIPAFRTGSVADPTGCGDSYLSGVCAGRLLGLSGEDAPWLGSWIAGRVAGLTGVAAMTALRGLRDVAAREVDRLASLRRPGPGGDR